MGISAFAQPENSAMAVDAAVEESAVQEENSIAAAAAVLVAAAAAATMMMEYRCFDRSNRSNPLCDRNPLDAFLIFLFFSRCI